MKETYKFVLKPLPYDYDALEPYIDAETMKFHHDKHHQSYLDNLNKGLENETDYQELSLEELLAGVESLPSSLKTVVEKHAGGVYNHYLYFDAMKKDTPLKDGKLKEAIERDFGSLDSFLESFKKVALGVFGSGWAWLVKDHEGKLSIMQTQNQLTPLHLGLTPVLNVDVWEHSYYLKHQNKRAAYLEDFVKVINWDEVSKRFDA